MQKIDLFFILAFKEQTYLYDKKLKDINEKLKNNIKLMDTTLTWHFIILSKYFNLYNFYEYQDKILEFNNPLIYHLPYGKDDNLEDIEKTLLKFKGEVPIVMRNYDAHSSIKLSKEYMLKYHDLCLSYLSAHINNNNILFAQISYDNFLMKEYNNISKGRKFACIILRKESREGYFEESEKFTKIGLNLQKTYHLREVFAKYKNIDVYGGNWPLDMLNYKGALKYAKKHETLNQYKFNFVVENAIVDNYLSEKILDCFVSLCVPVYIGSPIVEKYIPKECFIDIRNFKDNDKLIDYLENMSEDEHNKYIENILKYRDKIFDSFSTKNNFAKPVYQWYQENIDNNFKYNESFFDEEEQKIKDMKYMEKISLRERLSDIKQTMKLFWYQKTSR